MIQKDQFPAYYPVFLNISDKACVVIGGGQVALRKVQALIECGAAVKVISPDLCAELNQLAESGEIETQQRRYRDGDLKDAHIVIVATDDHDTNREVVKEANQRAVLVNVVDDAGNSNFIVPSSMRRGDVTIAVSTAGRSPALARKIRTRLEYYFGDEYASLALLLDDVRKEIKRRNIKVNGEVWQEALNLDLLNALIKNGKTREARDILLRNLKITPK